jgi:hypothetical protein
MPKRIHELARDWGIQPKDLVAKLEELGVRGKRSQSSLTDDEVTRLETRLGLAQADGHRRQRARGRRAHGDGARG